MKSPKIKGAFSLPLQITSFILFAKGKHSAIKKIPQSSCARKEIVDTDQQVLPSTNGYRNIMQPI